MTTTTVGTYNLDISHSEIGFRIKHLGLSTVKGSFKSVEAVISIDGEDLSSLSTKATIDVTSIDTKNDDRDNHLRSADFFDAETFASIGFESTAVSDIDGNSFKLHGNLTIRDTTLPIVLSAEFLGTATDPWGNERIAFEATGEFNRKDFGLTWNQVLEAGGVLVGEEVTLTLDLQAVKG